MARLTPDPTFYASPSDAAAAPDETHAYVVTLNTGTNGDSAPDALTVLDLEDGSTTYGQIVGRLDMPNVGDELHHFGWNACSSALCPWAAAPARRAPLPARPGPALVAHPRHRRQGRPAQPEARPRSSRPRRSRARPATRRPHTIHCGPDGIYVSALGAPDGDGPGGIFLLDHENFSVKGAWEQDRGPQELAYDFWWHLNQGTVITSEWGTPNMVENGLNPELLLSNQYGHKLHIWDLEQAQARPGDRPRPRAPDGARAAAGARPAQGLRVRRRRHLDRGPVGLGVAVGAQRRRHVQGREGHHHPGRAGRDRAAAAGPAAVRRGAAAGHRHRAVGRRPVARTSPAGAPASSSATTCPTRTTRARPGSVRLGGIVERARAPGRRRAQRRAADGRAVAATASGST